MVRSARRTTDFPVDGALNGARSADLREEVAEALERLSRLLVAHTSRKMMVVDEVPRAPAVAELQEAVRFLGQVAAAWTDIPDDALPPGGAGFGSTVLVEDLDRGVRERFTLMAGPLLDIDGGQVSLASPMGLALLGVEQGDVVTVKTPQRVRSLRIVEVRTLQDRIAEVLSLPAA